jgi:hypothetical protein
MLRRPLLNSINSSSDILLPLSNKVGDLVIRLPDGVKGHYRIAFFGGNLFPIGLQF